MEIITVEKLESILKLNAEAVGIEIGIKRSGAYKIRRNHPERYKKLMLGIRIYNSPLKIKEILDTIVPTEKIVESMRAKK